MLRVILSEAEWVKFLLVTTVGMVYNTSLALTPFGGC